VNPFSVQIVGKLVVFPVVIERSVVFGVLERFDLLFGDSGTVVERGILPYQVLKTDISEFLF
jgi:hypothetical protein